MLTLKVVTEHVPGGDNETETWQASRDPDTDHWHVRKNPGIQWSDEPFADGSADRKTVAQLLRKEHSVLY